jgi:hypothetical protein
LDDLREDVTCVFLAVKDLKSQGQLMSTRRTWKGDLDDRMVALRQYLVGRTNLADRTRRIPPYFRIIK